MPEQQVMLEMYPSLGMQTAINGAQVPQGAQRIAYDACMRGINTIGKRDGSAPITTVPLSSDISYLVSYRFPNLVEVGAAPTLAAVVDVAATLPADTYYVRYTYLTDQGETEASPEASQAIVLGEKLEVTIPAIPYHANSINIYISTATNTETLERNTTDLVEVFSATLDGGGVSYPTVNTTAFSEELLAVSGDTLYSYYGGELKPATMTDTFVTPDIYSVAFTDLTNQSSLIMADGGNLKFYNGSAVEDITPAANDPDPAPPNALATINALGIKYVWVHKGYLFVSDGSDTIWYAKKYQDDYFPSVFFQRWVRNNDVITGPGITFNNVLLVPMRRGWGILTGDDADDGIINTYFNGNQFLNTTAGNISPRGMSRITYPDGSEAVVYLSDDGVHEIFTVAALSTGDRQYATRSLTREKLDFDALGFTLSEKQAAVMWFDQQTRLLISISRDTTHYIMCYDTRNREWYLWRLPWHSKAFVKYDNINYFGGALKLLQKFSEDFYSDWDDEEKTVGVPVDFDVYSGLLSFEFTGEGSYLHYYVLEAQRWMTTSSIDVAIIYGAGVKYDAEAIRTTVFIWDFAPGWDLADWANLDYTELTNQARRMVYHKRARYFQRRWRNNRDEPVLILRESFIGSVSGIF
ncbi:hypothetical protein [Paenibacillus agaridevorans]|uniref:hypothetical protein n=1 Tax=Paenibacillus agaridevorans TaxID=171404 RepID=UPI001BE3F6D4|nr:hypothetical protein [Paenibacillus agaridevorans]